ncbi:Cu+-exporting ATPase [Geothermobacter ehrlichii]|uniref:Cu+-exporting ATPase n=1 Tax=Geothermobacter ehrlichii TaxID=213224 RepID=A0A5D3WIN3_9BACT|nr:heavy metal translocating P-type ATPase [Geothermobacter ehrlichii]TYO98792.1 Cu+-exporting ATPase [Geothermobacter ehrlichii]
MKQRLTLPVQGMKCGKCVAKLEAALSALAGVEEVKVDLDAAAATLVIDDARIDREAIRQAIVQAGFVVADDKGKTDGRERLERAELKLYGMSCTNCARTVEKGLSQLPGVREAQVNFALQSLQLAWDPQRTDLEGIRDRIRALGFRASAGEAAETPGEMRIAVGGMSCSNCARSIEKRLLAVDGVHRAVVSLADECVSVHFDPEKVGRRELFDAIVDAGYRPLTAERADDDEAARQARWLVFAALLSLPIMPLMWFVPFGDGTLPLVALLSTVVQFSAGLTFYRGAWHALRNRSGNMDLLVALGISAAWSYSCLSFLGLLGAGSPVFFETSALLITFIRFGKWLESRARGRASRALRELLDLRPQKARLLVGGREKEIPADLVEVGDRLLVRPGEKIPVDGIVIEGEAAVDESLLTGESVPVTRRPGDAVTGGTIDRDGRLVIEARRVGQDTALSQIAALVAAAQADKAPIQRLADRVSNIFVPAVVSLSLLTFVGWYLTGAGFLFAFQTAVAVMVIACPCALGLATPTAIMVGSTIGLKAGILFKKASVLENVARLQVLLLDKTGTLTSGLFRVTDIRPAPGVGEAELLALAGPLAAVSNHPLSRAVASRAAGAGEAAVSDVVEQGGGGVSGRVAGRPVLLGSEEFLTGRGVETGALRDVAQEMVAAGKSLVWVAREGKLAGFLALQDSLKPDAAEAVAALRRLGLRTVLLTGDRNVVARAVAAEVGTDDVEAEVRPEQKLDVVRRYQEQGFRVGMVGDGINDAPALAAADVGIAIGSGTDVARETGDLVLVHDSVMDVARAIRLGWLTLLKIRQNLFWAFVYNLVGIPLAAGLFYPWFGWLLRPEFAGLAMAMSSVSVVSNSLLLNRHAAAIRGN